MCVCVCVCVRVCVCVCACVRVRLGAFIVHTHTLVCKTKESNKHYKREQTQHFYEMDASLTHRQYTVEYLGMLGPHNIKCSFIHTKTQRWLLSRGKLLKVRLSNGLKQLPLYIIGFLYSEHLLQEGFHFSKTYTVGMYIHVC